MLQRMSFKNGRIEENPLHLGDQMKNQNLHWAQ